MNLTKSIVSVATAPARVGLAAADASLSVASAAVGVAKRALGEQRGCRHQRDDVHAGDRRRDRPGQSTGQAAR